MDAEPPQSTPTEAPAYAPAPATAPASATASAPVLAPAPKKLQPAPVSPPRKSNTLRTVLILLVLLAALGFGTQWVIQNLNTVSTDDAYVNSYVTFVAPRVSGQVARVLIDDNNRVKKGDVLVQLDPEPFQVQVAIKQAAVTSAQADLDAAQASVRGLVAQVRSQRFALQHAIEDVDNQIAIISARVAKWEQDKATLVLAQQEFDRATRLAAAKAVSTEDVEEKQAALDVAKAEVTQSLEDVYEARVNLGLPAQPPDGADLASVPPDLDQNFSSVRQALADLLRGAAQLGVVHSSYNLTPQQTLDEFYKRDPQGDIDRIFAALIKDAPGIKQAQAALLKTQRDLDQANLDLRYCDIVSAIDGVVTRRNVNPGDYIQVGQSLMAVRSLKDVWIDANFKETELRRLRIGQHVDLWTDMYGRHLKFDGRISGFTMGTGDTLALLPAQNATGNFVKVVQRLPVRIDIMNYDPDKLPLFVGLSVTPVVDLKTDPAGPNAGQYLQDAIQADPAANSAATNTQP